jgi:hypothetical protein
MNFFSHYYLDKENENPYFIFGTLIPEFFPHFNQYLRKAVFSSTFNAKQKEFLALQAGIMQHYKVDALFHNSDFFKTNTEKIKHAILSNNALIDLHKRTYFLAHITLELLIDRVLLNEKYATANEQPEQFYYFVETIDTEILKQFFMQIGKEAYFDSFHKILARHLSAKYLFYYNDNKKFAEALLRLYLKINTHMQTVETKMALISTLLALELELQTEIQIFVTKFKSNLNQ